MRFSALIAFFLVHSFTFSQAISDSLSFENMSKKLGNNDNVLTYFDTLLNRWLLYETSSKAALSENNNVQPEKSGDYFEYTKDKKLVIFGSYEKNKEHGWFFYFDNNGRVKRSTHFQKGKLNGQGKSYYSNGQLRVSTDYKKGKKEGEILGFYMDGTRLFTGKYKKDRMIGQRMYYTVNGQPANGEMLWRHENGATKLTGKCRNGLPEGRFSHYDEAGNLTLQVDYLRGLPNGEYILYEDGQIVLRECYEAGKFINKKCY